MQHRNWTLRIEDMLEAISRILDYTRGMDLSAFRTDQRTIDAVVRNFEILGEAARFVPEDVQSRFPLVPWSKIRGMRHMLAHEYFGVNSDLIWKTATVDLTPLADKLRKIIASSSS